MTLSRKSAIGIAVAVVSGALYAPAIASADGHSPEPIGADGGYADGGYDSHSWTYRLPEAHSDDILDIPDHQILPDLDHKVPRFQDFHDHFNKHPYVPQQPVGTVQRGRNEPIQLPSQAPTDSLPLDEGTGNAGVPAALGAITLLSAAGVAIRRRAIAP